MESQHILKIGWKNSNKKRHLTKTKVKYNEKKDLFHILAKWTQFSFENINEMPSRKKNNDMYLRNLR